MSEYHANTYTELRPEIIWDKRGGWNKIRTLVGMYDTLSSIAQTTQVLHETTKNTATPQEVGLSNIDLSQPDPAGYAMLKITYLTDLMYQWTKTTNLQELSIYTGSGSYQFINSISGDPLVNSVVYTRLINGIEIAANYGLPETSLIGSDGFDPSVTKGFSLQDSQSIGFFRSSYNGLDINHKDYVDGTYTVRLKGIDQWTNQQVVLRKQFIFSDYDLPLTDFLGQINRLYTKTAIVNTFGGVASPIPRVILDEMPENTYLYAGEESTLLNSGKIQTTLEFWYTPNAEPILYGPIITS